MKDDFSQDEKISPNTPQRENSSFVNDDSIDWAKQVYLQLKQKQEHEKELRQQASEENNIVENKTNKNEDSKLNLSVQQNLQASQDSKEEDELQLGDFDDTFTWSAEVLAAQGKKIDQFSLDEIDWLSRLKQGLEKTRKGLVTDLLDKLGDDPLTPEILDDLETLLLRADAGVSATDQILDSLRSKLN